MTKLESEIKDERLAKLTRDFDDHPRRYGSGSGLHLIGTGSGSGLNLSGIGYSGLSRSSSNEDVSSLRRQKLELESKLREEVISCFSDLRDIGSSGRMLFQWSWVQIPWLFLDFSLHLLPT